MSAAERHAIHSIEDYVRLEALSNTKHEFVDGTIYAMGGGTRAHSLFAVNVTRLLATHLYHRRCSVHNSDARIRVTASGLTTYPDVSVVCGEITYDSEDELAITNPLVLVEVLSPSTEAYDRGDKLSHYQRIPSLQEIVFVAHDRRELEVVRRVEDGWERTRSGAGTRARLPSLDYDMPVDEVYRDPMDQ